MEWLPVQVGAGTWAEVFEPLEGVTFVEPGPWTLRHEGGPVRIEGDCITSNDWAVKSELHGVAEHATWVDCNPLALAPFGWQMAYRDVKLVSRLIGELPARPYSAIHVRRTDHTAMVKSWGVEPTSDEAFARWAPIELPIFLATDNRETQRHIQELVAPRGLIVTDIITHDAPDGENRATGLAHAAVDLFACARADAFLGSPGSSFTATIELLRQMHGWWS